MLVLESHLGLITEGQFPIWGQAEDNVHTWELIYTVWAGCWGGLRIIDLPIISPGQITLAL